MTDAGVRRLPWPIVSMVTDRHRYGGADEASRLDRLFEDVRRAARAGVDLVQVRERGLDDRRVLALVRRISAAVAGSGTRVLISGRADVAIAAPCGGVHLPASSPPAPRIRELLPPAMLIGRSVHDLEEAVVAERQGGCDYLVFGTVYESVSKPAGHRVAGVDALRHVCDAVRLPVLAIGGIVPDRLAEIAAAGAAGIAAIGVFVSPAHHAEPSWTAAEIVARVHELFEPPELLSR